MRFSPVLRFPISLPYVKHMAFISLLELLLIWNDSSFRCAWRLVMSSCYQKISAAESESRPELESVGVDRFDWSWRWELELVKFGRLRLRRGVWVNFGSRRLFLTNGYAPSRKHWKTGRKGEWEYAEKVKCYWVIEFRLIKGIEDNFRTIAIVVRLWQ